MYSPIFEQSLLDELHVSVTIKKFVAIGVVWLEELLDLYETRKASSTPGETFGFPVLKAANVAVLPACAAFLRSDLGIERRGRA